MIRYFKIKPPSNAATAYRVERDGEFIGYVWSRRGFSYRGTQGWNRGVRIHDYHPWEWCWGTEFGVARARKPQTRAEAAQLLIEETVTHGRRKASR